MNPKFVYFSSIFFFTFILLLFLGSQAPSKTTLRHKIRKSLVVGQVHISFGAEPYSINIAWVLGEPAEACYVQLPEYSIYNPDVTELNYTAYEGGEYRRHIYNVTATHLDPGVRYSYKVVCTKEGLLLTSSEYEFYGPSNFAEEITVLSIADMATGYFSDPFDNYSVMPKPNILKFLKDETKVLGKFDALLHAGDYGYDLSSLNGTMGDKFMTSMEPVIARLPYMTTTGNHESHTNFTHYLKLFKTPGQGLHYSFDLGPVHFVMIDSEAYVGRFSTPKKLEDHHAWLKEDLESTDKPWIVMLGHRPIYCNPNPDCKVCTNSCTKYCLTMAQYLEELLNKHKVALYVSADVHLYERTVPIYKNETAQEGTNRFEDPPSPIYIVNGVAGNFDREDSISNIRDRMPWNRVADDRLGWGTLFANRTHLGWKQYAVGDSQLDSPEWFDQQAPVLIDEFWIVRD
mmetsp:Transcript_33970/g.59193  ORF Transcript_33970/g.59193 Transcript_33970/m.59193 type:complete len:458 (-) Transcript_33970:59-1432(-)